MDFLNFADIYRSAHLSVEPSIMTLRQTSADRFFKARSLEDILGLVKLHFGLAAAPFRGRLIDYFRTEDNTFSVIENERELTALSTALLASLIAGGDRVAAVALTAGSFAGKREASICPNLTEWAKQKLCELSVQERAGLNSEIPQYPTSEPSKAIAQIDTWVKTPEINALAPILKQLGSELTASKAAEATYLPVAFSNLSRQMTSLQEELSMMWWNVGGYSSQFNIPFQELKKSTVPILVGVELAELTIGRVGPAAIGALAQIKIKACKVSSPITLEVAVESAVDSSVRIPELEDTAAASDLCPVITAIRLRKSVGTGIGWTNAFKTKTGFAASVEFSPLDLAMQMYREMLLVNIQERQ